MKFVKVSEYGSYYRSKIIPVPDDYIENDVDIDELSWEYDDLFDEGTECDDTEYEELKLEEVLKWEHLSNYIKNLYPDEYKEFVSVPVTKLSKFINDIYVKEKEKKK